MYLRRLGWKIEVQREHTRRPVMDLNGHREGHDLSQDNKSFCSSHREMEMVTDCERQVVEINWTRPDPECWEQERTKHKMNFGTFSMLEGR